MGLTLLGSSVRLVELDASGGHELDAGAEDDSLRQDCGRLEQEDGLEEKIAFVSYFWVSENI